MPDSLADIILGKCSFDYLEPVVMGEARQGNTENIGFHRLIFGKEERTTEVSFDTLLFATSADDIIFSGRDVEWPYSPKMTLGDGLYRCVNSSAREFFVSITGGVSIEHYVYQDAEFHWQIFAKDVMVRKRGD